MCSLGLSSSADSSERQSSLISLLCRTLSGVTIDPLLDMLLAPDPLSLELHIEPPKLGVLFALLLRLTVLQRRLALLLMPTAGASTGEGMLMLPLVVVDDGVTARPTPRGVG